MKKITLLLSAIVILMASCGDKNAYTITGSIEGEAYEGKAIYLQALDDNFENKINIDTAYVKDGKFKFTGLAESGPTLNFISYGKDDQNMTRFPLAIEPGNIKINIAEDMGSSFIKGTPMNDRLLSLLSGMGQTGRPDSEILYDEFVKDNMQNYIGVYFFVHIADDLSVEQKKELLAAIAPEYKENAKIKRIEKQLMRQQAQDATAVGNTFTDVKGKTPEGKDAALSDYAGKDKYVLVDFWASWCPPCREEMPKLVDLYSKYKNKGLEIVGISLDKDNEAWKNGITKLKITWPQISDLKHWDSDLSGAYGVNGIPHLLLIDKDGKIIERGLGAQEMGAKLAELLK